LPSELPDLSVNFPISNADAPCTCAETGVKIKKQPAQKQAVINASECFISVESVIKARPQLYKMNGLYEKCFQTEINSRVFSDYLLRFYYSGRASMFLDNTYRHYLYRRCLDNLQPCIYWLLPIRGYIPAIVCRI